MSTSWTTPWDALLAKIDYAEYMFRTESHRRLRNEDEPISAARIGDPPHVSQQGQRYRQTLVPYSLALDQRKPTAKLGP
jgi:hypothetical protein